MVPGLAGAGDRDEISLGQLLRLDAERQLRVRKFSKVRMDPRLKRGHTSPRSSLGSTGLTHRSLARPLRFLAREVKKAVIIWRSTHHKICEAMAD